MVAAKTAETPAKQAASYKQVALMVLAVSRGRIEDEGVEAVEWTRGQRRGGS
jgi:hypothetical protein